MTLAGRRVAIEVATVPGPRAGAKARLRDDRVACRVLAALEAAIAALVPDGRTVILTLGAPIRVPNRTVAAVTAALADHLAGSAANVDQMVTILGNRVRFRVLDAGGAWTSKAVGFVFSGDPSPGDLAGAMGAVRDAIAAKARICAADRFDGDRWLVLTAAGWIADGRTYRRALAQLAVPEGFQRILMMTDDGRIETLVG